MARFFIITGLSLVLLGIAWPLLSKLPLGRLPGDFVFRRDHFSFYFPLTTSLLVSIVLSLLFWFFRR